MARNFSTNSPSALSRLCSVGVWPKLPRSLGAISGSLGRPPSPVCESGPWPRVQACATVAQRPQPLRVKTLDENSSAADLLIREPDVPLAS